ncbi:acyl-CoA dehydrogenase family protein [Rhizobium sp.]|uniref:acyl-CoA dehydrogenase family protein n=1 Tax=Rhizobium sp. TaxID=391 RepID=UPI0028A71CE5
MDTIPYPTDRIRQLTARLISEEEAIAAAHQLAHRLRERADIDRAPISLHEKCHALAQSGLLAITVPPEYGGIDVSNTILAKVIAILTAADEHIGEIPRDHFYILEALRTDGSEEQKSFFLQRTLSGDIFAGKEHDATLSSTLGTRIERDGLGYRINGRESCSADLASANWIAIFALNEDDKLSLAFVPPGAAGIEKIRNISGSAPSDTAIINNTYVQADAVIPHYKGFERPTTICPAGQIIDAGIHLGIARARFAETIDVIKALSYPWTVRGKASDDPKTIARVGEIAIRLEAATALVESAGLKIDIAQVETTGNSVLAATLAAAAAQAVTSEIAVQTSDALRELTDLLFANDGAATDGAWRDGCTHAAHDPTRQRYHAVGNFHLNGVTPQASGVF